MDNENISYEKYEKLTRDYSQLKCQKIYDERTRQVRTKRGGLAPEKVIYHQNLIYV